MRKISPATVTALVKPTTSGSCQNGTATASSNNDATAAAREAEAAETARKRRERFKAYKKDLQAVKSVAVIVLVFMMCWLPLSLSNAISALCPWRSQPLWFIQLCIVLSHMNSSINPFLYAYGKEFRLGYKRTFHKMFPCICALTPQDSMGTKTAVNAISAAEGNNSTNDTS